MGVTCKCKDRLRFCGVLPSDRLMRVMFPPEKVPFSLMLKLFFEIYRWCSVQHSSCLFSLVLDLVSTGDCLLCNLCYGLWFLMYHEREECLNHMSIRYLSSKQ